MFQWFERLVAPFPQQAAEPAPKGLFAFCRYYSRGIEIHLAIMMFLTAAIAVCEVTLFGFLGQLVDWLVSHERETFLDTERTRLIGMALMIVVGIPALIFFHATIVYQTLLGNYPMRVRWLSHRFLLRQSVAFYQNDFAGRLSTKVMQTSLAVREMVMKILDVMVYILVYFVSMLVIIGQADIRLMLPMVVWLAFYIGIQMVFIPRLKAIATEQADARSTMTGRVVDSYTNIQTVKLFSHTARESDYARDSMDTFLQTVYKQMRLVTGLNVSIQSLNYLLAFSIAAISIALWLDDLVTVGSIALSISLALRINGMAQWIMWEMSAIFEHMGTVTDGINTLSKPLQVVDDEHAQPLRVSHGKIELKDVCFQYERAVPVDSSAGNKQDTATQHTDTEHTDEEHSHEIFNTLNLTIKAGEKVGLVGRSGAGKSTLVNLLLRFYDLKSGQILIDGQDIKTVQQDSLREHIGMVTQDTSLLHRSVRDNILYGRPDATDDELNAAIQRAEAQHFIHDLEDPNGNQGLDAQVGERGVKLSGGQRQRIAIARVMLKDAPILLLDEATSALDSEVEAAIQDNLNDLMGDKTVIAIAHRLSTIAAMDRLIVLDKGQIAEQGTHQELIEHGGIYAQLWAHQTGGFIGE